MRSLEEPQPRPTATPCGCAKPALETGNVLTEPIGYLESCFIAKNGTPRQPSICSRSRACLRIRKSVFNNPEHALMGLEQFSHVWILFVFHKNGHLSYKAKVQPPRLNGAKTGVFSTRSPHRPNAIGLTLAKLERVEGGAVYLSGIDMIHGTPVLDIKPYIVDYDSPQGLEPSGDFNLQNGPYKQGAVPHSESRTNSCDPQQLSACATPPPWPSMGKPRCPDNQASKEKDLKPSGSPRTQRASPENTQRAADVGQESSSHKETVAAEERRGPPDPKSFLVEVTHRKPSVEDPSALRGSSTEMQPASPCPARTARVPHSVVPAWVKEAPAAPLQVRFTPHAEMDLEQLSSGDADQASFKYFRSAEEAKYAIEAVLSADPRSVYRRKLCGDRLFYFTVDRVHVTCWFGDGFAEVLRIKLAGEPVQIPDGEEPLVSLDLREPLSLRQPP